MIDLAAELMESSRPNGVYSSNFAHTEVRCQILNSFLKVGASDIYLLHTWAFGDASDNVTCRIPRSDSRNCINRPCIRVIVGYLEYERINKRSHSLSVCRASLGLLKSPQENGVVTMLGNFTLGFLLEVFASEMPLCDAPIPAECQSAPYMLQRRSEVPSHKRLSHAWKHFDWHENSQDYPFVVHGLHQSDGQLVIRASPRIHFMR